MQLVALVILIALFGVIGLALFIFMSAKQSNKDQMQNMSGKPIGPVKTKDDIERIKRITAKSKAGKKGSNIEELLFSAGKYRRQDRVDYERSRIVSIIAIPCIMTFLIGFVFNFSMVGILSGLGLGLLIGATYPRSKLDKECGRRREEILYYLPLVVEQISIGTSGGLDPGTCISHVIKMSEMRESHNAVTQMLVHVIRLVRTGMNLENALKEVGDMSYMNELKHTFLFLAQCVKHGGEVGKQLQDLSDSVALTKQVHVEEKITALPVKATFPLFLVFAGFFIMLVVSVFSLLISAMQV
jgi:Flp pilus assembly protein TadB